MVSLLLPDQLQLRVKMECQQVCFPSMMFEIPLLTKSGMETEIEPHMYKVEVVSKRG